MKRVSLLVLLLSFVFLLSLTAHAGSYIDDMASPEQSSVKSYNNLVPQGAGGNWAELPNKSLMAIQNAAIAKGDVVYRVQNPNSISITTYSANSTNVCRNDSGNYVLGNGFGGTQTNLSSNISRSSGRVYIVTEGKAWHLTYERFKGYVFKESQSTPSDLTPYGLAVWHSVDGSKYSLASTARTNSTFFSGAQLYKENWAVSVPTNARYIKVEINDVPSIEAYDGSTIYPKTALTMTLLGQVEITGSTLIMGEAEPIKPNPEITTPPVTEPEIPLGTEKAEAEKKASTKKATVAAASGGGSSGESKQVEAAEDTKKFEGTITNGGTAPKSTSKSAGNSTEVKPKATIPPETVPEETEQQVYYVQGSPRDEDGFSRWVTLYIVLISGALLFVVLRSRIKK